MKIVILGAGRRGIRLARHLTEENEDVVLMDEKSSEVENAMTLVDCLGVVGSGTDESELKDSGVDGADAFIALTGSDETNLVSCGVVSNYFNVPLTIASVKNLSFSGTEKNSSRLKPFMGISRIVNPYKETAEQIFREIEKGIYSDIISFENSSLILYNVCVQNNSSFNNCRVADLRKAVPGDFIITALNRSGSAIVPNGDTEIISGDVVTLVAKEESVDEIAHFIGTRKEKPKKITIVGATKITDFILKNFSQSYLKRITVIAKDKESCDEIADKYPDVLVVNDSITKEGVFYREGLNTSDLLIAVTDNDELNILTASYAKHNGVKISMAIVNKNQDFIRMADHLDIDSLISTQDVTVDSIVRYLNGKKISNSYLLFGGSIEAFQFEVSPESKLKGKALKDIDIRGKGIVAGVVKGGNDTVIPSGNYVIEESDVLIVVMERKYIRDIRRILDLGDNDR